MLTVILAESALETIPQSLHNEKLIRNQSKKRGKPPNQLLLDMSIHHVLIKKLENSGKRGRPDIVHYCLLNLLGSPTCIEGDLQVYVHTINGDIIYVNPKTRLPKNYNRFVGLMEKLFKDKIIKTSDGEILLEILDVSLEELVKEINPNLTVLLSEEGEKKPIKEIATIFRERPHVSIILGGFPHGTFADNIQKLSELKLALYEKPLEAWIIASRVVFLYELARKGELM
ncbi:MAG: 16S rRNA methyltransferase [Candidatus Odinarchaeia archaeon]